MTARAETVTFADTNILVYAHGVGDEDPRARRARRRLAELWRSGTGVASSQVLQEFYAVVTRKLTPPLPRKQARGLVGAYAEWCRVTTGPDVIVSASLLEEQHALAFWDALIVEAALRSAAGILLTEDLQDGRSFGDLVVENPFGDLGAHA
jgi:predicted nucleic acid-binding protein